MNFIACCDDKDWIPLFYNKYTNNSSSYNNITTLCTLKQKSSMYNIITSVDAIKKFNKTLKNKNWTIPNLDNNLYKVFNFLIEGLNNILYESYLVIFIHHPYLKYCMNLNKKNNIPQYEFFKYLLHEHIKYSKYIKSNLNELNIDNSNDKPKVTKKKKKNGNPKEIETNPEIEKLIDTLTKPVDYDIIEEISNPPELSLQLYRYQKQDVKWMRNIESKAPYNVQFDININYKIREFEIDYDINTHVKCICNVHICSLPFYENNSVINGQFYGGVLADEVGLGKTIDIITLATINKSIHPAEIGYRFDNRVFSKATVIICPSQLCSQWKKEIEKVVMYKDSKVEINKNIIMLLTKVHLKKYSYKDLCEADYVIISFNYLRNPAYTKFGWQPLDEYRKTVDKTCGIMFRENTIEHILSNKYVNLSTIYWNRLVFDEFHELYNFNGKTLIKKSIATMKGNYRWCVSGTPFANKKGSLHDIIFLLTGQSDLLDRSNIDLLSPNYEPFFRRNTKQSIIKEFKLPDITEITKFLDFTVTERNMYNAYISNQNNDKFSPYLRKLCCHPNLAIETRDFLTNCKSMKDVENMMVKYYKNLVVKSKHKIIEIEQEIIYNDNIFNKLKYSGMSKNNEQYKECQREENRLNKELEKNKKELKGHESSSNFFNNVIESIKNDNVDECGICLGDIEKEDTGVTKCGHIYCYECLTEALKVNKYCPYCRNPLKNNDFFKMSYDNNEKEKEKEIEITEQNPKLQQLIDKIGTKLAHLVLYLNDTSDHCIIFSQWHDLLANVGKVLEEHGIKSIFCKGTAYHRAAAIKRFNEKEEYKIIMLSSSNAASGTNLTKAKQIIFLDPVYGEYKYRKDIENQAIARAHRIGQNEQIKVVRFVVKNTVESELYNETIKQDKNNLDNLSYYEKETITKRKQLIDLD